MKTKTRLPDLFPEQMPWFLSASDPGIARATSSGECASWTSRWPSRTEAGSVQMACQRDPTILRVDSAFCPTIVLIENRPFPWVSGGFLERGNPGKNGEGSTRTMGEC